MSGSLLQISGNVLRWEPPAPGAQTKITYAVLTASYSVPADKRVLSPDNCAAMRPFADIVSASPGLSEAMAKRELEAAFGAWAAEANLTFVEVGDLGRANIIIGSQDRPAGRAFANLSYRSSQETKPVAKALGEPAPAASASPHGDEEKAASAIEQAYVCLNPASIWKIGFDGNLDIYDLRYTFTHEIGHAIGLDHPDIPGSLMGYRYDEKVRSLQPQDIAAVQNLYGPPSASPGE